MTLLHQRTVPSPLGLLQLVATPEALVAVIFPEHQHAPTLPGVPGEPERTAARHPVLDDAEAELSQYFTGARTQFTTRLAPHGTEFQRRTWQALTAIPYGETRSYAQLAAALDRPTATRAVGAANSRNPLSIFVPCHRVIGADGSLTGYAGGMAAKRWLLDHERRIAGR